MKAFSLLLWLLWIAIAGRVLLAPVLGLTLSQALVLFLVCAPAVGLLTALHWVLRSRAAGPSMSRGNGINEDVNHERQSNHV
jgi:hypothetical protein